MDIDVHRKVELQNVEATKAQQNAFKELCNEFKDIFSTDSSDIGKTPLIEMEIDTGDSPPITQKPYTLLVVSWYSLEQYIGFVVRQAFNYCCSLHQV